LITEAVEESEQLQMTMSVSIVILKDIGHVIVRIDEILQGEVEEDHFQDQDLIQIEEDKRADHIAPILTPPAEVIQEEEIEIEEKEDIHQALVEAQEDTAVIENIKPAIEGIIITQEEDDEAIVEAAVLVANDIINDDNIAGPDQKTPEKEHHHRKNMINPIRINNPDNDDELFS